METERCKTSQRSRLRVKEGERKRLYHVVNVLLGFFELLQLKARVQVSGERHASPTDDPVNIEDGR